MNISLLIRIIFFLAFFQGIFSYIGVPVMYYRTLLELFLLILYFVFIHFLLSRRDKTFRGPGLIWFVIFTIAVFASALLNNSDFFASFRMYSRMLWPYLFFLAVLNINLSVKSIKQVNNFIYIMVILQIPAALYKYVTYGVREGGLIGTISTQAGALSTIFPLFIISYLISFYYCYKKNSSLYSPNCGFYFLRMGRR
jgi:hypothetical protein